MKITNNNLIRQLSTKLAKNQRIDSLTGALAFTRTLLSNLYFILACIFFSIFRENILIFINKNKLIHCSDLLVDRCQHCAFSGPAARRLRELQIGYLFRFQQTRIFAFFFILLYFQNVRNISLPDFSKWTGSFKIYSLRRRFAEMTSNKLTPFRRNWLPRSFQISRKASDRSRPWFGVSGVADGVRGHGRADEWRRDDHFTEADERIFG